VLQVLAIRAWRHLPQPFKATFYGSVRLMRAFTTGSETNRSGKLSSVCTLIESWGLFVPGGGAKLGTYRQRSAAAAGAPLPRLLVRPVKVLAPSESRLNSPRCLSHRLRELHYFML
jgi:hypothetical protein